MRINTTRVYLGAWRGNTEFITINALCNKCKKNPYSIKLKEDPRLTNTGFVNLNIKRKHEHEHEMKKIRITKDEREQLYEEAKLNFNGSAKNYVDALHGCGASNIPTVEVVRKIISEQQNLDQQSTDWITNILAAMDSADSWVRGDKVFGYVQTLDVS